MSETRAYDPADPSTWSVHSAAVRVLGVDLGQMQDHSALVSIGIWPGMPLGVFHVAQLSLGTSMGDVADRVVEYHQRHRFDRIALGLSNNVAFPSLLAGRVGQRPANVLQCAAITAAETHALAPTAMAVSVGGKQIGLPRWSLSKAELVETLMTEFAGKSLKVGNGGDVAALQDELTSLERIVRRSGSVAYSAPSNQHDDIVMALSLAVWAARRFSPPSRALHKPVVSSAAWT
jgi:hypothetical protein